MVCRGPMSCTGRGSSRRRGRSGGAAGPSVRPRAHGVLAAGQELDVEAAGAAVVAVTSYEPEEVTVQASLEQPATCAQRRLVPGWQATVDGHPQTIERATSLSGRVPARARTRCALCTARDLRVGLALSLLAWLVAAVVLGVVGLGVGGSALVREVMLPLQL